MLLPGVDSLDVSASVPLYFSSYRPTFDKVLLLSVQQVPSLFEMVFMEHLFLELTSSSKSSLTAQIISRARLWTAAPRPKVSVSCLGGALCLLLLREFIMILKCHTLKYQQEYYRILFLECEKHIAQRTKHQLCNARGSIWDWAFVSCLVKMRQRCIQLALRCYDDSMIG